MCHGWLDNLDLTRGFEGMNKNWNTDTWPQESWDQVTCVHSKGTVPIQQSVPTVLLLCIAQWGGVF